MKAQILSLVLLSTPALAGGMHDAPAPTPAPVAAPAATSAATLNARLSANAAAAARSSALSTSRSSAVGMGGAGGNGFGGAGGSATGGNARAAGGSVTNSISMPGTMQYGGSYTLHNNPDLAALVASTANQCATPAGATTSFLGVGLGGMFTSESRRCNRRQDAAALVALGRPDAALALLQQTDEIAEALKAADAARPLPQAPRPAYCTAKPRETAAERLMRQANC